MIRRRSESLALRALLVLFVGVVFAIPIARANGQSTATLRDRISAAEARADRLNAGIGEKIVELAGARQQALTSAREEAGLTAVLAAGREREAALTKAVTRAQADLDAARARLTRARSTLAGRLVDIYKSGSANTLDVLLEADGFDDLAARADLLGRIQDADRGLANRVADLRRDVAVELDAADEARARTVAHNARIATARDQIAAARSAAEADAAALAAARRGQESALATLDSRVGVWRRKAARLAATTTTSASASVPAGDLQFGNWAIPEAIVMCESGGNFAALNPSSGAGGAYQILPSTWASYGGKGLPHRAAPAEQHRIAAMIWADSGPAAWVCSG